jgi:hypothetical protein
MPGVENVAEQFANSLDAEDYETAAKCLTANCEYTIGGRTYRGPDAIIDSYRKSAEWGARTLDRVRYANRIRISDRDGVVAEFVDYIEHAGLTHTHRCEQRLEFDEHGLISRIRHTDLPGERRALDEFFGRAGVTGPVRATDNDSEVPEAASP